MTAHIEAKKSDIAKTVIMPGDPKRAEFIAKTFLKDYKLVNNVRGMLAFTGKFDGQDVTVMASGMGMPSIGIYSYELYQFYDVENIIRIGSAGSYDENIKLYDVLLVTESYSDSSFAKVQNGCEENILKSDETLNEVLRLSAQKLNIPMKEGRIYSSDVFYLENHDYQKMRKDKNCLATEMESFALFHNANICHKKASCLLTISNHFLTGEETTSEEREKSFTDMMLIALNSIKEEA